jgi:glutaredoxin
MRGALRERTRMISRLVSFGWRWTRAWYEFWKELLASPQQQSAQKKAEPKTPDKADVPVMVYLEWDSPGRAEIEKILKGRGLKYQLLAIDRDEATKSWLEATVKREPPVVFIGGDLIGGLDDLKKHFAPKVAQPPQPLGDVSKAAQVYGRKTDTWTNRVTDLFDGKQVVYDFVDLDEPKHAALPDRLVSETKRNLTPYVFVRGRYLGGFNAVDELERLGQLDDLLAGRKIETDAAGRPRIVIETAEREGDELPPSARN